MSDSAVTAPQTSPEPAVPEPLTPEPVPEQTAGEGGAGAEPVADGVVETPGPAVAGGPPRRRLRGLATGAGRLGRWPVVAAAVLTAAAVGLAVWLVLLVGKVGDQDGLTSARNAALASARQAVVDFIALDYRHTKEDFAAVDSVATGSFKADFDRQKQAGLAKQLADAHTVSTATLRDSAVTFATTREASVLVAVDNQVTTTKGTVDNRYRLQVHMVKVGDSWKIEDVTPL